MEEIKLFLDRNNHWVTNKELLEKLLILEADKCDVLFIHTSLSFGIPNSQLKRSQLLAELLHVIKLLGVRTICMPTFTFSFCNGCNYDPTLSASKMGALNEFFRKQEGAIRSIDPLMSVALMGEDKGLVLDVGHYSCGACSIYDFLHHRNDVKFLFLGTKIGECMTYMHYLEWLYSVDYRYDRLFVGNVNIGGRVKHEEYWLFSRYNEVKPNVNSFVYEQRMYDKKLASMIDCGNSSLSIVRADNAAKEYLACLQENPYFFVDLEGGSLIKDKTFIVDHEIVAM